MDFNDAPILVIGDVMLDHYITGDVQKLSPEAPVPVVNKKSSWAVPGGAANVARGLARLGCQAKLVGLIGADGTGEALKRELSAEGIKSGLPVSSNRPTTCKTRIMARGQQLLRVDEEISAPPSLEELVAMRVNMEKLVQDCKAIILSDYAKGALLADRQGKSICQEAISLASELDIPVLVDPKGLNWQRYSGAQCVTPNTSEFIKIMENMGEPQAFKLDDESKLRQTLADNICDSLHFDHLLLTRGPKGMVLYTPGAPGVRIQATMREVADVSGAGDTVIATLAACVANGLGWDESARIANIAAGIAVGKVGTAPVSIKELNRALGEKSGGAIYKLDELLEISSNWRKKGNKTVFTNGCFDLLHPGHVALLKQAASFGDKLIVGLNSDQSVKRLKGPSRPVQDENSRACLLAALEFVDAVVIFEEDTPENLIMALRPDHLVKGGDYTPDSIVGAEFIKTYGGQLHIVPLVNGQGTTKIIKRIQAGGS